MQQRHFAYDFLRSGGSSMFETSRPRRPARAAAAFRGKCCEHPEQDEHGNGWASRRERRTPPRHPRRQPARRGWALPCSAARCSSPTTQSVIKAGLACGQSGAVAGTGTPFSCSPAVPPACHNQRSPAVSHGHSRSLRGGRWAGRAPLTWGRGVDRNCMACKGSGTGSASGVGQQMGSNRPP
jgi:hypothetical protein